ncbi:MAG: coenzyme F420-0:L-glutamate ligase [Polyangiaceae bacterium]|nr:coenzyme F420-0:L-glutamate ligase [Polyangiaceae bacterium]
MDQAEAPQQVTCAARLEIVALPGFPIVSPGDNLAAFIAQSLTLANIRPEPSDVFVVTSKVVSRAEGRFVDLNTVIASDRAREIAAQVGKDARVVELILRESTAVSRITKGAIVVRHKLGFVCANAGLDMSNAKPKTAADNSGPWVLLLPEAPDQTAASLRGELEKQTGVHIGIVISDSFSRPFRLGTVGAAIGISGLPALWDRRGEPDLFGRTLEQTVTALGDQIAAAADLVAGQANEGRAVVLVRGLRFAAHGGSAEQLQRPSSEDVYA